MEEKEIQPKKKGGKKKTTDEPLVENQVTETTTETLTDTPTETESTTLTETPVDEKPLEEQIPQAPIEEPKPEKKPIVESEKPETKKRKPVPTIAELRKHRGYNESVFTFSDGFACTATSQRTANSKHEAWLACE
jgi:vesicle coat complex subunit